MLNIYVIGCGGIGGYLLDLLPETFGSLLLDSMEKGLSEPSFTKHLESFGSEVVPQLVDRLVLIDGDDFSPRNALRQGYGTGNKLQTRIDDFLEKIDKKAIRRTYLRLMDVIGYNQYLAPWNMPAIIPKKPPANINNQGGIFTDTNTTQKSIEGLSYPGGRDVTVVFVCVDNHKTRYEVSRYAEEFDNIVVINGGNEKTTGNVTIYERRDGVALDPNLPDVYTEITPDADLRPDETDPCTHVSPKHDQVAVTNNIVAALMLKVFTIWFRTGMNIYGPGKNQRRNEVLLDLDTLEMFPVYHPPRKQPKGS